MSTRDCTTCALRDRPAGSNPCRICLQGEDFPHWHLPQEATGVEAEVCADIARRQQMGVQKYGTTVADNPLPHVQWLQHAYEEALDLAIYLKRAIHERS